MQFRLELFSLDTFVLVDRLNFLSILSFNLKKAEHVFCKIKCTFCFPHKLFETAQFVAEVTILKTQIHLYCCYPIPTAVANHRQKHKTFRNRQYRWVTVRSSSQKHARVQCNAVCMCACVHVCDDDTQQPWHQH